MRNIPTKVDGTSVLPAVEINSMSAEMMNAVQGAGLTLSVSDSTQLGQSLSWAAQLGNFFTDVGSANGVSLTNSQYNILAYVDGMLVRFLKASTNTSTVTINVSGLGAVNLLTSQGNSLTASQLSAGSIVEARYSTSLGAFVLNSPVSTGGSTLASIGAASAGANLTLAQMNTIINVTVTASTTLVLPALSTVPEGGKYTVVRNGSAAFPLILDGNGAETVGSLADQRLWGTGALMEVTRINSLWVVTRTIDPPISLFIFGGAVSTGSGTLNIGSITGLSEQLGGLSTGWYDFTGFSAIPLIAGTYSVITQNIYASNATGLRGTGALKNGSYLLALSSAIDTYLPAVTTDITVQTVTYPSVIMNGSSDTLQVRCYQTSGGGLNVSSALKIVLVKRTI